MVAHRQNKDERTSRPGLRRRRRRVLLAGLVCVVAFLAWRRNELVAPVALRIAHGPIERATGLDVSVRRFAGSWIHGIELAGVHVRAVSADALLRDARVARLSVRYDLGRLVRGDLTGLVAIEADQVTAELDLTRGADDTAREEADAGRPSFELPGRLPRLDIGHVDLTVRLAPGTQLELSGLELAADGAPRWAIEVDTRQLALETDGERYIIAEPSLRGAIEGGRFELALDLLSRPLVASGTLVAVGDATTRVAVRLALEGADVARDAPFVAALLRLSLAEDAWAGRLSFALALDADIDAPLDGTGELSLEGSSLVLHGVAIERLEARARLAERRLEGGALELASAANRLRIDGFETPLQAPDLATRLATTRAEVAAELTDIPALVAAFGAHEDGGEVDHLGQHRVALSARLERGLLTIADGTLDYAGGHADVRRGSLPLIVGAHGIFAEAIDVELDVALEDVAALGALVEQDGWHGSLEGAVVLHGTLDAPRGRARLAGHDLAFADLSLGELALQADADGERVLLERLSLDGPLARLDASGRYDLAARRIDALHAAGQSGPAFATRQPALAELAGGELAFELDLSSADDRLARIPPGALAFDASWTAPALAGSLSGTLRLDDALRLALDQASFAFGGDELTLERPVELAVAPTVVVEDLALTSKGGGRLRMSLKKDERALAIDAELLDFEPPAALTSRFPTGFVVGPISGVVHIDRAADELTGRVTLQPIDVRLDGWPAARLVVQADARGGRIELERLALEGAGFALELSGGLPFDPAQPTELPDGPLAVQGTLRIDDVNAFVAPLELPPGVLVESGAVSARIAVEGTSSAPRGGVSFDARDLAVVLGEHEAASRFELTSSVALELGERTLELVRGSIAVDGDALTGTFSATLAHALDLSALGAGTWDARDAGLVARATLDARDLGALAPLSTAIRRLSGTAVLEVELAGTPAHPEPRGTLRIRDGALRTDTALPAIAGLDADLALDATLVRVAGVHGELGGAPFQLDGTLVPWGERPTVDLAFSGEDLLLYRLDGVRVRADGELVLSGALAAPLVSGSIALRNGRYVKDFDILPRGGLRSGPKLPGKAQRGLQLFSLGPPLDALTFALDVRSATPFEIDNNLTRGALRPELHLSGTGAVPILDGTIYLDPTRVSLPSGTLHVRSGTVVFDDANPFLPTLEIQAEIRLYGYDIALSITGPYDRPEVELSSVPALSNEKLLLMVLTGARPDEAGDANATAQDVAMYVAKDLLGRLGSDTSTDDEASLLDRVEVVFGGDVTRSGSQTTRGSLRIADHVLREDDQLFLTAEKDVYDKINFGVRILFRFP